MNLVLAHACRASALLFCTGNPGVASNFLFADTLLAQKFEHAERIDASELIINLLR